MENFANDYARLDALEEAETLLRQAAQALREGGAPRDAQSLAALRDALRVRVEDGHAAIEQRIAAHGRTCYTWREYFWRD